ncbi:hypothetical protein ACJX0J_016221, partial [Zea mays]
KILIVHFVILAQEEALKAREIAVKKDREHTPKQKSNIVSFYAGAESAFKFSQSTKIAQIVTSTEDQILNFQQRILLSNKVVDDNVAHADGHVSEPHAIKETLKQLHSTVNDDEEKWIDNKLPVACGNFTSPHEEKGVLIYGLFTLIQIHLENMLSLKSTTLQELGDSQEEKNRVCTHNDNITIIYKIRESISLC